MSKHFTKFATPDWDTTSFGDEMCRNLFKGNERKSNKLKKRGNPKGEIYKSGRIEKLKTKNKRNVLKEKVLETVGKSIMKMKKMVNPDKNMEKDALMKIANGKHTTKPNMKMKKILPKSKYLVHKVRENLKRKHDPERVNFLSSSIDSSITEVDVRKTNKASTVKTKNKPKRKKIETLKKNIEKKVETNIKKLKRNIESNEHSKFVNGRSEDFSNVSENIHKIKKTPQNLKSDVGLFENKGLASRKNKKGKSLRERMLAKLKASRFRYLNEEIYTMNSKEAQKMFTDDPESFEAYHEGYRLQVNSWPINPVDVIISDIKKMSKSYVVADFGCGDAKLSREVEQKVHSFDLVATNEHVTACDMANVPLKKGTIDVVVFCLSLMGTNIHDYLKEANRVLKIGGILKIAEVASRFDDVDNFIEGVQRFGYQSTYKDISQELFHFIDFKKITNIKKSRVLPTLSLHPCLYKKR